MTPMKTPLIAVTLLFALFVALSLPARAEPGDRSLDNLAIVPFDSPDPTAIQMPGKQGVYVFSTGRGIPILYSENMFDWKRIGRVFPKGLPDWAAKRIEGARAIWAPDIVYLNGLYHIYYSVSTFGGQRSLIALAVNKTLDPDSPDYAWEDRGIVLESLPDVTDYNAIDSALYVDTDGKAYLFWGSYWTGLKAVEVDPKTGKPFRYEEGKWKIPADYIAVAKRRSKQDTSIEAPYVIRRGDWYYLFTSRGSCCDGEKSTYSIYVGRSNSPLGPYVDKRGRRMDEGGGSLVLESTERWKGTGHNGFLRTGSGAGNGEERKDWLILASYDTLNLENKRMTQIRPLTWDENDWPVAGEILERK